jgi:glucose-6-phosphate 1-dehydrogenase
MKQTIVIFGASGDLTRRKLIPALYELKRKGRLPLNTQVVGFSRTPYTDESWREYLRGTTKQFVGAKFCEEIWSEFARCLHYRPGDITRVECFQQLDRELKELEGEGPTVRIYYLSTLPEHYDTAVHYLGYAGMAAENNGPRRIVVEKPFGVNLKTARQLNAVLHEVFEERQIFRIDHYLGKETVQNLLVLRFANAIFEPIWNRNYIDHVQITAAEAGAVGPRGGYYESAGVLRDMFQNHLLQLLTLTAMEAPARFDADFIRDEKVKVLRAITPMKPDEVAQATVRGQYRKYRDEPHVSPQSTIATFAAVRLYVENWRWRGVPFYLRSGKAMMCNTTQVVIQFQLPPHMMFATGPRSVKEANRLVIQIQPAEGIQLHFHTKVPDAGMQLRLTELSFRYRQKFSDEIPDAYQRLLLDVMNGDASLFARADEVELAWGIIDPILEAWETGQPPLTLYEEGEWGPPAAEQWMEAQGRRWFNECPFVQEAHHQTEED